MEEKDEKLWGMLCHISTFVGGIIAALVIWLIKREESDFVDHHGVESLNFQISILIYLVVSAILTLIFIGIILIPAIIIFDIVMVIIASIRANEGERYRYPLSIPFLKTRALR